jgi:hypothetical protein
MEITPGRFPKIRLGAHPMENLGRLTGCRQVIPDPAILGWRYLDLEAAARLPHYECVGVHLVDAGACALERFSQVRETGLEV